MKLHELKNHLGEIKTISVAEATRRRREEKVKAPSLALAAKDGKKVALPAARPQLRPIRDAVAKLAVLADHVAGQYELPNMFALASMAVSSAAMLADLSGKPSAGRRAVAIVDLLMRADVVGIQRKSTRWKSLFQRVLGELPASQDGKFVRIKARKGADPTLEPADSPRAASSCLDVFQGFSGKLPERALESLDAAKRLPIAALRSPVAREKAIACPDIGVHFLLAMLDDGWTDDGFPVAAICSAASRMMEWMEVMAKDLQTMANVPQENAVLRAKVFGVFADRANGEQWTEEEVEATIGDYVNLRSTSRETGEAVTPARASEIDARMAQLQRDIDAIAADAIDAADALYSFLKSKREEKEGHIARRKAAKEGERPKGGTSTATVGEAVAALRAGEAEVEVEISEPPHYGSAIGLANLGVRKRTIEAAGVDQPRQCAIYEGVVWEVVIGPLYNALDFECVDADLRQVVIAPRRPGGMGVDLGEARVIALVDFEEYFEVC